MNKGGSIEIPEGYEILDIEPWVRSGFRTAQTGGLMYGLLIIKQ